MRHGPEGQEQEFGDGIQAVDLSRIMEVGVESDPDASREAYNGWEVKEFENIGNAPIDDEERFRLLS